MNLASLVLPDVSSAAIKTAPAVLLLVLQAVRSVNKMERNPAAYGELPDHPRAQALGYLLI